MEASMNFPVNISVLTNKFWGSCEKYQEKKQSTCRTWSRVL